MERIIITFILLHFTVVLSLPDKTQNATSIGATYGVDVSQFVGIDGFKCLNSSFAIVRAYQSLCEY